MRLGISVEGATEREFVSSVLAPFLAQYGKYATPIDMRGNVSLDRIEKELRGLLQSFDHVTTFYDFYGFKNRPPGTVDDLEQEMTNRVLHNLQHRFRPYVQLHEFEALVLASPDTAEAVLEINGLSRSIQDIVSSCGGAENVNDGRDTCPSRRIQTLAPIYDKKLHGPVIVGQSLETARRDCPRFNNWLTALTLLP